MATPPTIADIDPAEVDGDVMRLLTPMGRALRATEKCLRQGITLADNVTAYVRTVDFLVPDDWVLLTPVNDFVSSVGAPALAVRKAEDGEVVLREAVTRAAGPPAADTIITTVPASYAPGWSVRRLAESSVLNTLGGWRVDTSGNVRWLFGDPSAPFFSAGGSWVAADRRPEPWSTPLLLDVQVPWKPAYVRVLDMRYAGERLRRLTGAGPVIWQEVRQTAAGVRQLEIQRIMGLVPTQKYTMTLGVFPE